MSMCVFSSFFCPNHVKTHEEDRHNVIVIGLKHVSHLHVSHCFQDHSSKSGWTRSARAKNRSMCFSPRPVEGCRRHRKGLKEVGSDVRVSHTPSFRYPSLKTKTSHNNY